MRTGTLILAGLFLVGAGGSVVTRLQGTYDLNATRERAAAVNAQKPKSADESHIINDNVVALTTRNQDMIEARRKAAATLDRFLAMKQKGAPGTYLVKIPLTQNGHTEHIWMQLQQVAGTSFAGLLADEPVNGTRYKMGDLVVVERAEIEDWMIKTPQGLKGGYTSRVAIRYLPEAEAARMRALFID